MTAVSYNAQFASKINVPEPPYIEKFKDKLNVKYDGYEAEEANYYRRFLLVNTRHGADKFSLDTMPYYNFLFPEKDHHLCGQELRIHYRKLLSCCKEWSAARNLFAVYKSTTGLL
jgi:hypothetical protein